LGRGRLTYDAMTGNPIGTVADADDLPPALGERHTLAPEEELRIEVPFQKQTACIITLQKGSAELYGVELALHKSYTFPEGGLKIAVFTWHGCVLDVDVHGGTSVECYMSDETSSNVAVVNTHAQLEALRDQAAAGFAPQHSTNNDTSSVPATLGPRVLVVGPPESGKSTVTKTLLAYAVKLGRLPLWVDLDPVDNGISIPGTLAACPVTRDTVTIESWATTGIPSHATSPLILWHGSASSSDGSGSTSTASTSSRPLPDLFRAQATALGQKINARLAGDDLAYSSGIIVNTNGWIQEEGFQLLMHTVEALQISVVLVLGHDKLYSMFKSQSKLQQETPQTTQQPRQDWKVIKLPRSGGVATRDAGFLRSCKSRALKRYFYGELIESSNQKTSISSTNAASAVNATPTSRVPQLTPFLIQLPWGDLTLYKFSSMTLSASLLPVAAAQTTEAVQITRISQLADVSAQTILAVCHPQAVVTYEKSQDAADLYTSGVAGFVNVERIVAETETLHLLTPCAGTLPSMTLIWGNISWME
jgi:polyribonucleotide 5'-hydroxyl-kinase